MVNAFLKKVKDAEEEEVEDGNSGEAALEVESQECEGGMKREGRDGEVMVMMVMRMRTRSRRKRRRRGRGRGRRAKTSFQ